MTEFREKFTTKGPGFVSRSATRESLVRDYTNRWMWSGCCGGCMVDKYFL